MVTDIDKEINKKLVMKKNYCIICFSLISIASFSQDRTSNSQTLTAITHVNIVDVKNEKILAGAMLQMTNKFAVYNRKKIAEDAISKFSYRVIGKKLDEIYSKVLSITHKK